MPGSGTEERENREVVFRIGGGEHIQVITEIITLPVGIPSDITVRLALGKAEKNRSIWRETRLAFLLIFILVIPKINLPFGDAFLEYSVDFFVEKRKTDRLQMPVFLLS